MPADQSAHSEVDVPGERNERERNAIRGFDWSEDPQVRERQMLRVIRRLQFELSEARGDAGGVADGSTVGRLTWLGSAPPVQQLGREAAQKIRAEFAQRLQRRLEAMQSQAFCRCKFLTGRRQDSEHLTGCPVHTFESAARIVQVMLDEQNGKE